MPPKARKTVREQDMPVFAVPAAWCEYTAEAVECFFGLGYLGVDPRALVRTFLVPDVHTAQQILGETRDSHVSSVCQFMSRVSKSSYISEIVDPGGLSPIPKVTEDIPAYTTVDWKRAVEFMIVYTLTHAGARYMLNKLKQKVLQHFDANASGTYKDLQKRRGEIEAFYSAEQYVKDVQAAAEQEFEHRHRVLMLALRPVLLPLVQAHYSGCDDKFPGPDEHPGLENMIHPAAVHALGVACARLQERRDDTGYWYSDECSRDTSTDMLTPHRRTVREDFYSPAYMAVEWFDAAFTQALDLIHFGWCEA